MNVNLATKIIDALGGTSMVAEKVGITASAVSHWKTRGLPANIRIRKRLEQLMVQRHGLYFSNLTDELWHG